MDMERGSLGDRLRAYGEEPRPEMLHQLQANLARKKRRRLAGWWITGGLGILSLGMLWFWKADSREESIKTQPVVIQGQSPKTGTVGERPAAKPNLPQTRATESATAEIPVSPEMKAVSPRRSALREASSSDPKARVRAERPIQNQSLALPSRPDSAASSPDLASSGSMEARKVTSRKSLKRNRIVGPLAGEKALAETRRRHNRTGETAGRVRRTESNRLVLSTRKAEKASSIEGNGHHIVERNPSAATVASPDLANRKDPDPSADPKPRTQGPEITMPTTPEGKATGSEPTPVAKNTPHVAQEASAAAVDSVLTPSDTTPTPREPALVSGDSSRKAPRSFWQRDVYATLRFSVQRLVGINQGPAQPERQEWTGGNAQVFDRFAWEAGVQVARSFGDRPAGWFSRIGLAYSREDVTIRQQQSTGLPPERFLENGLVVIRPVYRSVDLRYRLSVLSTQTEAGLWWQEPITGTRLSGALGLQTQWAHFRSVSPISSNSGPISGPEGPQGLQYIPYARLGIRREWTLGGRRFSAEPGVQVFGKTPYALTHQITVRPLQAGLTLMWSW